MEHDDRAPVATFYSAEALTAGATALLGDGPAHHARVKRLSVGDAVRLTDGAGGAARGTIARSSKTELEITIYSSTTAPQPRRIHLRVPIGDRDRMLWLAEKATELGIATWQGVRCRRSASVSPRGEGPAFAEKVRARMIGALEQSGGAWLPQILPDTTPDAIALEPGMFPLRLDARGAPVSSLIDLDATAEPVVLFGPEGGLEPDEIAALDAAGWHAARLAATTLRFETAGIAAVAVLRAAQLLRET